MRSISIVCLLLMTACATSLGSSTEERPSVVRDAERYAIASCLTRQSHPYLRDQGDAWASAIVQTMAGDPALLGPIVTAVDQELNQNSMAVARDDATGGDKNLPIMHCAEIGDAPEVRRAINTAVEALRDGTTTDM